MLVSRWTVSRALSHRASYLRPKQYWTKTTGSCQKIRGFASARKPADKINYNTELFVDDSDEHANYELVTARELEANATPPRRVKMLVRDFIEDSLYNPNYGYFPRQATIFTTPNAPFDFPATRDTNEFQSAVAKRYAEYGMDKEGPGRQIWHTPTELFKPWYGQAVAQCLISEYLRKFPSEDFVIYEIGAGNGTLAMDVLDFIRERHPDLYKRTRYNIIEISGSLAEKQRKKLRGIHPNATVAHQSIFQWTTTEHSPCFFIAMEVIDNFAHDMIRYDLKTLEPYQGFVSIDESGDFATHFTPVTDNLVSSLLALRQQLSHPPPLPSLLRSSGAFRNIYSHLPFAPNLSKPEYIPTRLFSMLQTLRTYFPLHRLLLSDFSSLPDTIPGYNAPVVQTRYQNNMVTCTTLLVQQGYFDIFFPTDFERLQDMYGNMVLQPSDCKPYNSTPATNCLDQRQSKILGHAEFLKTYADVGKTRLHSGENPMLDFYKNVKFIF